MKKLIALFIALCMGFLFVGCEETREGEIKVPEAASYYKGKNYKDVNTELELLGFTNITTEVLADLVTGWLTKDGDVERVSINGKTDFYAGRYHPKDAKIVITYHTFPEKTEETSKTETVSSEINSKSDIESKTASSKSNVESKSTSSKTQEQPLKDKGNVGDYYVEILNSSFSKDYEDKDVIIVNFKFTNNSKTEISFGSAIKAKAYQDGIELDDLVLMLDDSFDNGLTSLDVKPGATFSLQKAFLIRNNSQIEIEVSKWSFLSTDVVLKKIFSAK